MFACPPVPNNPNVLQVVVMGKSLGGAVALHLAADNPSTFKAIVVENTFLSIEDVAPKVPLLNRWDCTGSPTYADKGMPHSLFFGAAACSSHRSGIKILAAWSADAAIPWTSLGQGQGWQLPDSQQVEELPGHPESWGYAHSHAFCWTGTSICTLVLAFYALLVSVPVIPLSIL